MTETHDDSKRFTTRLIVRTYEVDGFLHVNNAVFVQYLEAARGDYVRAVGLGYAKFHEWRAYPVLTHLEVDYESPARADEELEITLWFARWRRTRFSLRYEIRHAETGELVARARTDHAFIDPEGKAVRVPEEFRRAFSDR